MNYRHIYHAGNFADCLKHIILVRILLYLQKKEKPYFALDSHAGTGHYDLASEEAQKTGEWQDGIARLLTNDHSALPQDILAICQPYFDCVKALNPEGSIKAYPGSPKLMQMLARPQDRSFFIEKHPLDCETLKQTCGRDRRSHVRLDDGWVALRADLPPLERRGVVLIDPPFEEPDEYVRMITQVLKGYRKWPTGIYCLWYPIKARRDVDKAALMLQEAGVANSLRAELIIHKLDTAKRLNGTGLFIINPPFTLHDEVRTLLPFLAQKLGQTAHHWNLEWICPPK